jgi:6-phosphogluconolactonase
MERIVGIDEIGGIVAADLAAAHEAAPKRFTIAVSGGSVGPLCFPSLAQVPLDWMRTEIYQVDERAVPPDHPDSNYRLLREHWPEAPSARVRRIRGEAADLEFAAREYGMRLRAAPLDWVLLGVGPDGHVASLFPGHALLEDTERAAAAVYDSPKPPPRRVTVTLPTLLGAGRIVIVATGKEKARALHEARTDPGSPLPVARLLRAEPRVRVLLLMDGDAGVYVPDSAR